MGYRLGVDLGTTFTAAAVDDGTGATMLGLGNRALTVPSVVFLSPDGTFLFGEAAERRAAAEPTRSAREFKRRIGDTVPILVAGQPFSPQALSAKLLAWTTSIATQRQGSAPDEVVVTYPANWGGYKRELLHQLVSLADLPSALTCTEPEAAATQYASRDRLSPGDKVAVYDLGGGTFDVCVLEKDEEGFTILGSPDGVEHLGGIDFDEAVFQHVVAQLGDRLSGLDPGDPQVTDGLARLRRECVDAKEALSSDVEATVAVALPGLNTSVRLTRAELDGLITSPLRDTLDAMQRALRSADLTAADLTTVVLVGGSSRIPLVSHLLQSEFGVRTAMDTHPKHDVALGAVRYHQPVSGSEAPAAAATVAQWPTRGVKPTDDAPLVPDPTTPEEVVEPVPTEDETPGPVAEPETATVAVPEVRTGPPVWTPPAEAAPPPGAASVPAGAGSSGRRFLRGPVLLGAAAAVLVVAGITAYVVTSGGGHDQTGGGSPGTSTTTDPAVPTSSRDILLLPVVTQGSIDPVLRQISTTPGTTFGTDLGPVAGLSSGSQSLPTTSRDGHLLVYRWAPPHSGFPGRGAKFQEVADGGSPVDLFNPSPAGLLCTARVGISPDGSRLALPCKGQGGGRPSGIYVFPIAADGQADGSRPALWATGSGSTTTSVSFTRLGQIATSFKDGPKPGVYVGRPDQHPIRLTSGDDLDAVASPKSDLIAFTRDGDLYLAATDGGPNVPCPATGARTPDHVTGTTLCDLTGTATSPDVPVSDPAWSWGGHTIAYDVQDLAGGTNTIYLIGLSTGTARVLIRIPGAVGASGWAPR